MNVKPNSSKKTVLLIGGITTGVIGIVLIGTLLTNNFSGNGSNSKACEKVLNDTVLSVSGVESVTVDCNLQFGGDWQRAEVHLNTSDMAEAQVIATNVMKAYASQKSIEDSWATPQLYVLKDGSEIKTLNDFNGTPSVRQVRSKYSITP